MDELVRFCYNKDCSFYKKNGYISTAYIMASCYYCHEIMDTMYSHKDHQANITYFIKSSEIYMALWRESVKNEEPL